MNEKQRNLMIRFNRKLQDLRDVTGDLPLRACMLADMKESGVQEGLEELEQIAKDLLSIVQQVKQ